MNDFVTGRGRKIHLRDTATSTACGVGWDRIVDKRYIDRDEFCSNCYATRLFSEQGGRKAFAPAPTEAPTTDGFGTAPATTASGSLPGAQGGG